MWKETKEHKRNKEETQKGTEKEVKRKRKSTTGNKRKYTKKKRRRKEKKLVKIHEQELLQSEITEVAAVEAFGSLDSPVVVANESFFDTEDLEDNE